jgi:hypothetical protein
MNDLLPPDRRSIPERRRALMRERLDNEIGSTTTVDRRDGAARRFGIPALVAAAVAALAIGGYVIASDSDDGGADPSPAGQGEKGPKADGQQKPAADLVSKPMANPDPAYRECIDLTVHQYEELRGEPIDGELEGRLAIDNGKGVTVVVVGSSDTYTCNIKPDQAVSHPNGLNGRVDDSDFWFALNVTSNVLPGDKGDMVWVGGEAPNGVTDISYTFPDGHTEEAVVQDGFWALQYFSDKPIPSGPKDRVEVTLDGPDGRTVELPFTINTQCNQVTHGC